MAYLLWFFGIYFIGDHVLILDDLLSSHYNFCTRKQTTNSFLVKPFPYKKTLKENVIEYSSCVIVVDLNNVILRGLEIFPRIHSLTDNLQLFGEVSHRKHLWRNPILGKVEK